MIEFIGFNQVSPYAVLEWHDAYGPQFKTICYDEEEMNTMLARHNHSEDFYAKYKVVVIKSEESFYAARVS